MMLLIGRRATLPCTLSVARSIVVGAWVVRRFHCSFGFLFAFDFALCALLPVVASRASARASLLYFCLMVTLRGEGKRAKERDIWIKKIEVSLPFCFIFSFLVFGLADARSFVAHMALR